MKKILIYFLFVFAISFLFAKKALAICPICTIAVGTGVGFSRWLGVNDTITGLWLGGFIVSIIAWTESWLEKKNIRFKGRIFANILAYYALIIIPLYYSGIIGNPMNTFCFCGLDKLLFGIIAGSLAFWFGASWYFYLKEKNNDHVYFPFQKVVMSILPLIIMSIIFYFL
ncbi:hypothetical protein KKA93_01010 [Patescibacteria group bacterium]|nr:hypothetical protein [Patescibacteria group bacterium]MBU1663562.1 hypothetical protein [Patescibacteria group bacterium]MBU1934200.1 hypothetical protein [Patescibacteria group bacterium]MBU2007586.1 hypothetical protein [Patescibacteria group bacterium]MBU2233798.1 hypothetical protein [Patescibacteria group bacterium]